MILHPDHAMDLAAIQHRELVARAEQFRAGARLQDRAARKPDAEPDSDCRVPIGLGWRPGCRPDPRSAAAAPASRARPRRGSWRHWKPHRAR